MASTLSKNLCWLRRSKGLTKKQTAYALSVEPQEYIRYESDKICPSIQMLMQICDFYEISMEDILLCKFFASDKSD